MRLARVGLALCGCVLLSAASSRGDFQDVDPNDVDESSIPNYVEQGWTKAEREQFYRTSGGSFLLPCSWFLALEQKDNLDLFVADHNIAQLHLVPSRWVGKDPKKNAPLTCNGERLPVGIAVTEINDSQFPLKSLGHKWVGLTCAFCHTGQLHYTKEFSEKDTLRPPAKKVHFTLYVDGGPSMQYNYRFLAELLGALRTTLADGDRFARFADRVSKICAAETTTATTCKNDRVFQEHLKLQVAGYTDKLISRARIDTAEWGFGRFDALGRGANHVFVNLDPDNLRYGNAPVSIPQLWYAWRYNVVQWSGLIRHPIARNISQTIAVGAGLFEFGDSLLDDPKTAFRSTTDVKNLVTLENLVRKLKPPDWPEAMLGAIKLDLATRGKQLYAQKCAHCHLPGPNLHATPAQTARGQSLSVTIVPRGDGSDPARPNEIGTDPLYLVNAETRSISMESTKKDRSSLFGGAQFLSMSKAIERLTTTMLKQAKEKKLLVWPYDDIDGNVWEPPTPPNGGPPIIGYMARPHAAIWSTPPFLHNGSVPTLYDLLSPSDLPSERMAPPAEWDATWQNTWGKERGSLAPIRPKCFLIGDLEFDPVKVGYRVHRCDIKSRPENPYSGFNFFTVRPGNSNKGHEFTDYDAAGKKFTEEECRAFDHGGRNGVLGCALSHNERLELIEYLKTCDLDDLFDWKRGGTQEWNRTAPPKIACRGPKHVLKF